MQIGKWFRIDNVLWKRLEQYDAIRNVFDNVDLLKWYGTLECHGLLKRSRVLLCRNIFRHLDDEM